MVNIFITFHLVSFAWIFFRANSLSDAYLIIETISNIDVMGVNLSVDTIYVGGATIDLLLSLVLIPALITLEYMQQRFHIQEIFARQGMVVRWTIYYLIVMLITTLGFFSTTESFIYFQF